MTSSRTRRAIAGGQSPSLWLETKIPGEPFDWGVRRRVLVFPDLAWPFSISRWERLANNRPRESKAWAVNLRPWPGWMRWCRWWPRFVTRPALGRRGGLYPDAGEDLAIGRRLQGRDGGAHHPAFSAGRVEELVLELSQVKATLAMRLHIGSFFSVSGSPSFGLSLRSQSRGPGA